MTSKRRGRRPGPDSSRDAIVEAARREFAQHGFDRATIRSIADAAGVDPATIYHFFAGKDELLRAALEFPIRTDVIDALLPHDGDVDAADLLRAVLTLWEDPAVGERLTALLRVAATHPEAAAAVSELLAESVLRPLGRIVGDDRAELRAGLVGTQMAGLAMLRLVLPHGPVAEASVDDLVAAVAPTIERYLHDDLGDAAPT